MTPEQATTTAPEHRIADLRTQLNAHNFDYWSLNKPTLTDEDYDELFRDLVRLEQEHPEFVDSSSPTQRVGSDAPSSFAKVNHARPMLSLDNAFSWEMVLSFFKDREKSVAVVEPKIDGLSLSVVYANGLLVKAVTRGDGASGDDVTQNARAIRNLPVKLTEPVSLEVRGEVYMTFTQFDRLNRVLEEEGDDLLANPRNAAAGSLKLKDSREVYRRGLCFVAYAVYGPSLAKHVGILNYLEKLGFQTPWLLPLRPNAPQDTVRVAADTLSKMFSVIESMDASRQHLDFPTDGLVFKLNDMRLRAELGEGTRAPNWAVAYKFPAEKKSTKLAAVTVQVGKTGRLTPVAELDPVHLGGTMVSRASLCNQDEINRLGVDIGDDVWISKSAEIIPKVNGCAEKRSSVVYQMPANCPSCGSLAVRPAGMVDLYCMNSDDCHAQVVARLIYAMGKSALDMDGCGPAMVELLVQHGIRRLSDVFAIEDISFLKAAARNKFGEEREKAKLAPWWRKLNALCIEGVGKTLCQEIAARWPSLLKAFDKPDELKTVVGPVNYEAIIVYVQANGGELDMLDKLGVKFESGMAAGPLSGKVFVITGTLMSGTRDTVAAHIEKAGGLLKPSVSKKVHYLVCGESVGRVKTDAARKCGTQCITEDQLFEMIGVPMPEPVGTADREY